MVIGIVFTSVMLKAARRSHGVSHPSVRAASKKRLLGVHSVPWALGERAQRRPFPPQRALGTLPCFDLAALPPPLFAERPPPWTGPAPSYGAPPLCARPPTGCLLVSASRSPLSS
ncbi:hypothetical protein MLD38_012347 [Melastoma candidum]|uniref:Uncharacterized protein n=1 Tax=Melastoma candidum TaxID=119954 RepID=A0ACB9R613_9MYRT|nr:hypothetical protein MLD38_012347 [Melastoma candidum]